MALRIALVDDHELFLGGLARSLTDSEVLDSVTEYRSPSRLIRDIEDGHGFDLIVSDLLMGEMNGFAFSDTLRSKANIPVMLISGIETPPSLEQLKRHRISAFVHKSAPVEILMEAITAAVQGQDYFHFSEQWESSADRKEFGHSPDSDFGHVGSPALSERQIEVLRLISAGAANKEIAESLQISENTVKTHLRHIFEQLGVTKRTACVRAAKLHGLLE